MWYWRRFLRVPWTARRPNKSILKKINPEYLLGGLMLKPKLQYFGHLMWRADSLKKTLMPGKIEGSRREYRGWDDWMASPTWWTWVWVWSGSWWWTGKPGVLQSMGSQRVGHDWATELNCESMIILELKIREEGSVDCLSSVQLSHSVICDSLRPHGLQHARLPCPPPTPRAYSNSCPSSQWCHPTISSSVIPFSSHLQSFPASGSFPVSHFFASGGQSIGVSASVSFLPMNIQDWFPLEWTGWISLQSKGLSRVFANTTVQKHQFFGAQFSL